MKHLSFLLLSTVILLSSCGHHSGTGVVKSSTGQDSLLKVSQFDRAGFCDFLIDKSGTYHALFQESPAIGKPVFIYYATSTDKGASWSKPVALSDDGTGNSSGYARILQDGGGNIYAIWKRYGDSATGDVMAPTLDGPGGYSTGTLFYKVLNGAAWSNEVMLNETQHLQETWFATVSPSGVVNVVWAQAEPNTPYNTGMPWYYCAYMRSVSLSGATPSAYNNITQPDSTLGKVFPVPNIGYINLEGYVDNANAFHLIWEDLNNPNATQALKYFDGKATKLIYNYPQFKQGNTFFNPGHLLVDEKGNDHVIFQPPAATLQSEQLWDYNVGTNKTDILVSIQQQGISIHGFQASQGPNGQMAVVIEAGGITGSADAFGMFYKNGTWTNIGLTSNASKSKFFSKDFVGIGGYEANVALLTTYQSQYASVAYDAPGNKSLLMTIAGTTVGNGGYAISNPFVIYIPVDK